MYFVKTPKIVKSIYKNVIWDLPNNDNKVFLTFDDGPTKNITERILDILFSHNIKATFFCLGKQVEQHPEIFDRIIKEGHSVGNHSYSHLKGWNTEDKTYLDDFRKGEKLIQSSMYRPPYGKIKRSQLKELTPTIKIIMWDVLPGDFSPKNSIEKIVSNTVNNTISGSIIVLHDNNKCGVKMLKTLPSIIEQLKSKGFSFEPIRI